MASETIDQSLPGGAGTGCSGAERDGRARRVETVIIGGGQAGLAIGYHLTRRGRECAILDGQRWRQESPTRGLPDDASGTRIVSPTRRR